MRLLNPGPGEILDRLVILKLKIERAPENVDTGHFVAEGIQLLGAYIAFDLPVTAVLAIDADVSELITLNKEVWELIDLMHAEFYSAPDYHIAQWAKRTLTLNDRRAALVHKINIAFGLNNHQEKI